MSLGLLLLFSPYLTGRFAGIMQGLAGRIASAGIEVPHIRRFPFQPACHPSASSAQPDASHHDHARQFAIWLILGIAAVLLFVVGNFSLIFHSTSKSKK